MSDFLTALGLVMVIEGALCALFPDATKKMMLQVLAQPQSHLRTAGIAAVAIGVGIVWIVRG